MYLIHIRLRADSKSSILPVDIGDLVRAAARPEEHVEHVVTHPRAQPHQVLGVYLLAERLEDAEARATALCRRALESVSALRGWELVGAEAPLVAPFYERLRLLPAAMDGSVQGRFRPSESPSASPEP
ncbi:hypothetical protein [Streptomyces sp. NPDC002676]